MCDLVISQKIKFDFIHFDDNKVTYLQYNNFYFNTAVAM